MSASLLIPPVSQFFDANGKPLAGGLLYTYAAGTSTPQAAYTDSSGSTAWTNPVALDAAGRASIWLAAQNYKIVCKNAQGVTQWTADNVSSVSLAELQGLSTLSTLTVSGRVTVGGNAEIDGSVTAASAEITGMAKVDGALTAQSAAVTGAATVGGTLGVTGATTLAGLTAGATALASLTVGGAALAAIIAAAIPATQTVSTRSDSGYFIATIPLASGQHLEIGFGDGVMANGGFVPLPAGFSYADMASIIVPKDIRANSSNNSDSLSLMTNTMNANGSIDMYQQGTAGARWPVGGSASSQSANWLAIVWRVF